VDAFKTAWDGGINVADSGSSREPSDDETEFVEQALLALDGHLAAEELENLDVQLAGAVDKRRLFIQLCLVSQGLSDILGILNEERKTESLNDATRWRAIESRLGIEKVGVDSVRKGGHSIPAVEGPLRHGRSGRPRKVVAAACVMVLIAGGFAVRGWFQRAPHQRQARMASISDRVATVAEVRNVVWARGESPFAIGARIAPREIHCLSGTLTLAFDSGARVTLEGPADVSVLSGSKIRAVRGRVITRVENDVNIFMIETPNTLVVDRGTEFGVEVDALGQTGVVVFKGSVELAHPKQADGQAPMKLLGRGEALRVGEKGRLSRIVAVDRRLGSDEWSTGASTDQDAVIHSVRDNIQGMESTKYYQIVRRGLDEDVPAYVDRRHEWNGLDSSGLPASLRGADYIMTFNDDKWSKDLQITVELAKAATLYIFYDDRDPAPAWLIKGFTDTGIDIGLDEFSAIGNISELGRGAGRNIDNVFSVWKRNAERGESVTLGSMTQKTMLTAMYGIAAVARP
jgi:FecR protein